MDIEWAQQQLKEFLEKTELSYPPSPAGFVDITGRMVTAIPDSEIISVAQVIEQILDRVLPSWRRSIAQNTANRWVQHREASLRALAQLNRQEEIRQRLGDAAPTLDAAQLHPWVWEGARSLWQSNHYAEAVRAAAVKVNAETQNKVNRRDVAEATLFQQVFSCNPAEPGKPRLRLMGDDGSKTFQSLHRGAAAFAEGCFAALRNPGSHDPQDDLPEHEALEQLAAFSVLARWVDRAAIES